MEHAPLRPVPARPAGPIDSATALDEVSSWLPALPPPAARALALVALAERPRAEVAASLAVSEAELSELLADARKELRQTVIVLGGSGWCERAERLISDRLDGALSDRHVRRLDVHLRNCPRCVEHERRLVQATDALVLGIGGRGPGPVSEPPPTPLLEAPPAEEAAPPAEDVAPPAQDVAPLAERVPPADGGIEEAAPPAEDVAPLAEQVPPADGGIEEAAPPAEHVPPADGGVGGADAPVPLHPVAEAAPAAPLPPAEDQVAAAAEVLVAVRTRRQIAGAIVWNSMVALAILLALATIALTIAGILGAEL